MANNLSNKYFVKRQESDSWQDVTTLFDGIKILSIKGFNEEGESVNVYSEQWVNSQTEDFLVTTKDENDNDVVIRKNVDLEMTFIAGSRYSANGNVDTQNVYDLFKDYICKHGDFYIKSSYSGKYAHVVCLKGLKPTTEKLHRGNNSYIMATATLHTLDSVSKSDI